MIPGGKPNRNPGAKCAAHSISMPKFRAFRFRVSVFMKRPSNVQFYIPGFNVRESQ